ncbi:MAG: DUF362 domain-containing protein [bacterium]
MKRPTVIIRHCESYDVDRIRALTREGLEHLELRPQGRTLIKPNVVASGEYFPHAYTRPEFTEGLVRALQDRADGPLDELAVGERCGITMPTRYAFKGAGYYPMAKRTGITLHHFDECSQVEIPLYHAGRLRDSFFTPEPVARADFFVNAPKFKAHPWTTVTFSMKNYIGIQDDRHRLIDHDHRLNEKVADLQYIIQPQFIAIDGIIAGEGRMLTPVPFDMKLVLMGDNQVAFDAVCCHLIGLDPLSVDHIRMAWERGFGPVDLAEIDVVGDVSLDAGRDRCKSFRTGLIRVEDYFRETNIRAYAGPPPDGDQDYCWGGCPGALEEAIEILRVYDQTTDDKMPPVHLVLGAYEGDIPAEPGEKVVFIGDCASFQGDIHGKPVTIESVYRDRSEIKPTEAKHADIFAKMVTTTAKMGKLKKEDVIRITGCPVSVAEQVLMLVKLGHLKNPYFAPKEAVMFTSSYLSWRTRKMVKELFGKPYNVEGPTERGDARPPQNLPPPGAATPLERSGG